MEEDDDSGVVEVEALRTMWGKATAAATATAAAGNKTVRFGCFWKKALEMACLMLNRILLIVGMLMLGSYEKNNG